MLIIRSTFRSLQIIPSSSFTLNFAYQKAVEIFSALSGCLVSQRDYFGGVMNEEGSSNFTEFGHALEISTETIYTEENEVWFWTFSGIDLASTHFYRNGQYTIKDKSVHSLRRTEYLEFLESVTKIIQYWCLKGPFAEDDWDGWKKINPVSLFEYLYLADEPSG